MVCMVEDRWDLCWLSARATELVVLCSTLALVACGGESQSHGNSSGGTSGGAGASAGMSGAAGPSGAGTAGAGGAGTGGSNGGAGDGGASGQAGAGGAGRGYHPPDSQVMGCTRQCELERDAMCAAETPFEKCVEGCHLGILFEVCSETADAVLGCIASTDSAMCSAQGTAVFPDCAVEMSAAGDCIEANGFTDALDGPCASHCTASVAAMCANGEDFQSCSASCKAIASAFPVCAGLFQAFLECSAAAEQTCSAEEEPAAVGCAGTFGTFLDCLEADYDWQPGFGIVR